MSEQPKYIEVQKFNQLWLNVMLNIVVVAGLFTTLIVLFKQISIAAFLPFIIVVGVFVLFKTMKLIFSIDENGVRYRFVPFHINTQVINKDDIKEANVIRYEPISEYGGWGIRYSFKRGKAFSTRGNYGLQLKLKNGKTILIGTQQPEALQSFLTAYFLF